MSSRAVPARGRGTTPGFDIPCPGARPEQSAPSLADVADGFAWLRADTLRALLGALAGVLWLATVSYLGRPFSFWPGWGMPLAALVLVAVGYLIRDHRPRLASRLLILGLVALLSVRVLTGTDDVTPFLYIPVVLIAGALERTRATVLVAVVATATVLGQRAIGVEPLAVGAVFQALLAIWFTVLTSWLTTRSLYTTLHWLWHSQQEATANVAEARRHRGELAAALKQLEEATYRLERVNYALNWARMEAEEAHRLKAQFAAHVSHELRTPVNLILGFSEMMLGYPRAYGGAQLPTAYQTDLQTLHNSAQHLQALVDDILDLSQLDAHQMPLMREMVALAAVTESAVETIRPLLNRKNLTIDVHLDGGMPTAFVDPLRIRQVLLNLLSNAVRHTTVGGITVRAWSECEKVIITVVDTGDGIDPREIPRLFDPFYRLSPSTGGHDGWGLGLAICRQFISLHGGTIDAASEGVPGRGTAFTITLPIHAPAASPPTDKRRNGRGTNRPTASAPSASVVVLDSDPHVVSLYRRRLSDYHVHGADSERAALELAEAVDAHALVVRPPPPEQHTAWHRHWSALADQRGLRIVSCSVASRQSLAQHGGFADFLVKPVTREALLAAVGRVAPAARTIAVVDDDRHMVRMLSRMLRSSGRGWRLLRAYDGQEGWELIQKTRPELVLVDLAMPRIGGLELLQRVRSDQALAGVALIAVSGLDAMDVLPSSDERRLELLTGRSTTISQILRGVQALLDALPPAEIGPPSTDRAPARVPVG